MPARALAIAIALVLRGARAARDRHDEYDDESEGSGSRHLALDVSADATVEADDPTSTTTVERAGRGGSDHLLRPHALEVPGQGGGRVQSWGASVSVSVSGDDSGLTLHVPTFGQAAAFRAAQALKVRAVSFNAGNLKFEEGVNWKDMFKKAVDGVQEESIDVVFFGFQELFDPNLEFFEMAKRELLNNHWLASLREFVQAINDASSVPPEIDEKKSGAMDYLKSELESFDIDTFMGLMKLVIAWAKGAQKKVEELIRLHPNLKIPADGYSRLYHRLGALDKKLLVVQAAGTKAGQLRLPRREARSTLLRSMSLRRVTVARRASRRASDGDAEAPKELTKLEADKIVEDFGKELGELLVGEFELAAGRIEMTTARQVWNSGGACHANKHYDTMLYAFVNPLSGWRVEPEPWKSKRCRNEGGGQGCSINNNKLSLKGQECGKVVNLIRFKASRGGQELRFCALNTHMSFKGKTSERVQYIEEALNETGAAGCDSLAFVGDFNSRLHCHRRIPSTVGAFPMERLEVGPVNKLYGVSRRSAFNSMTHVLGLYQTSDPSQFRLSGGGANPGQNRLADELSQVLVERLVKCFEGDEIEEVENPIAGRGLVERELEFNPTYKVISEEKAKVKSRSKPEAIYEPVQGMNKCYWNPSGKGKHNPAWTDRVLAWPSAEDMMSAKAYAEVWSYQSIDVPADMESDHMPVVATVAVHHGPPTPRIPSTRHMPVVGTVHHGPIPPSNPA